MRRRQIEVIRYRRVTVISASEYELDPTILTATEVPREEQDQVFAHELMGAQRCTRIQRLAISSQRLLKSPEKTPGQSFHQIFDN